MSQQIESLEDAPLKCPKCNGAMQHVRVAETDIDRCTVCQGLWFDLGEAKAVAAAKGAAAVDVGTESRGAEMNNRAVTKCPRCRTRLIQQRDTDQRHIQFESCQVCFGVFFDAGEFKDYQEKDLLEGLRRWFKNL
jgi:uncharacterized protein